MKIIAITKYFWHPTTPGSERGIEITDEQFAGLRAGTHKIGDDLKSVVEKSAAEIAVESNKKRIAELKAKLTATDYQSHKHADGAMSAAEYAPIAAQRQEWRDEINLLEAENISLR
jgi:hypothetical protein